MIEDRDFEHSRLSKEVLIQNRRVRLDWDVEASVWVATSREVPGLVLEAADRSSLLDRVSAALPELLELNETTGRC